MKKTYVVLLLALAGLTVPGLLHAQDTEDHEAIRMAVLDYVEGIYNVAPDRIRRSVSPRLAKLGYWRPRNADTYQEGTMSFDELVRVAETWNKEGRIDGDAAPKDIALLDVMDQTATVKLSAQWGVDYMHLAKQDGRWMIVNVLWQSYPAEAQ